MSTVSLRRIEYKRLIAFVDRTQLNRGVRFSDSRYSAQYTRKYLLYYKVDTCDKHVTTWYTLRHLYFNYFLFISSISVYIQLYYIYLYIMKYLFNIHCELPFEQLCREFKFCFNIIFFDYISIFYFIYVIINSN